MKKLLLLFATLISLTAKSQTSVYHPFPTTNTNWLYQYYDDFHNPTGYFGSYAITGDTVISGNNYKKISGCPSWLGLPCDNGSIREDNKIIYYWPDTASTEYVLYNFNLNLGDTLFNPYGGAVCSNDTAIVVQEDSVLASDGYHRRLYFNSSARWIEGVGAVYYLLNPCNVFCVSGNDVLYCMATDSGFTYPPSASLCIAAVPEGSQLENKISISPNPFTDKINITAKGNELLEVSLYDVTSRKIFNQSFVNSTTINTAQLAKGIYLYEVRNKNGVIKKGKVVKD